MVRKLIGAFAAAVLTAVSLTAAFAQEAVKIGAIYPLSGNAASAGAGAKAAIEVATEIINNAHPELGELTLAKDAGLPNLKGAKVEVIFADNQGTPAAGQNQALRLITEEKVHALMGAYQSGITSTASAIAEKYGVPFLSGESVAANLTERGFQMVFQDDADCLRYRENLCGFSQGNAIGWHQSRYDRHRQREYGVRHIDRQSRTRDRTRRGPECGA